MEGARHSRVRDRAARGAGVDRAARRAVAPRADRRRATARGHAARAAGARCAARRLADSGAREPRTSPARRLRRRRRHRPRVRQQADARGLRGDLCGAARAGGPRRAARSRGGWRDGACEDAEDARPAGAGRVRSGRRCVPRAPLGVLRDLLPRERPGASRRRGRAAVLALRTVQPHRALDAATVSGLARPLLGLLRELRGERRARRRACRPGQPALGGRQRRGAGCRRKRSSADHRRPGASRGTDRGARRGRAGLRRRLGARSSRGRHQLSPAATARPGRLPVLDRRGLSGDGDCQRAPGAGDAVRRRLEPRRARDPDARRDQPRSLAHEPDPRDRSR